MTVPVFCVVRVHRGDVDSSNLVPVAVSVGGGPRLAADLYKD
jgi:hypothetical protein